jgi:hypothetical protein
LWCTGGASSWTNSTTYFAMAFCCLHNYCINRRLDKEETQESTQEAANLPSNKFEITYFGGMRMADGGVSHVNNQGNIGQLLDGSNLFKDVDTNEIRNIINQNMVQATLTGVPLP